MSEGTRGLLILGNQLFARAHLADVDDLPVFMAEDWGLCTRGRHHKQKIVLFLAAMRAYRDGLREHGFDVHYEELELPSDEGEAPPTFEDKLEAWLKSRRLDTLVCWEIEDRFFERRIETLCSELDVSLELRSSPMFVTPREVLDRWFDDHRPFMANFYKFQRQRLDILVDGDGEPEGGRWSFDDENRKALPKKVALPGAPGTEPDGHVEALVPLVEKHFAEHPGEVGVAGWWLPTTRRKALSWLRTFLDERFAEFGPYEDALSTRGPFLFHSVLTPALNLGLITPEETLERALAHAREHGIPLNSLEGFVRQLIGWREFVRGVYRKHGEQQAKGNYFEHSRRLTAHWYEGTTGLAPLDHVIRKVQRYGYSHHIERLMVVGSLMTLCEIEPRQAYDWFMEMYVDSSEWVMVPNVYGMATFADGGVFATKPYICGSNYLRKMGDYEKPKPKDGEPSWEDTVDGLYWRFIDKHRDFFAGQARMHFAVGNLERMPDARRERLFAAAEAFLKTKTC